MKKEGNHYLIISILEKTLGLERVKNSMITAYCMTNDLG